MKEYVERAAALQAMWNALFALEDRREAEHGLDLKERTNIQDGFEAGQIVMANYPAADVVEVVRCKDCFYYYVGENNDETWEWCSLDRHDTQSDGFCAWGARKDG
ncbi:MAG: hypothetical protein IKT98_03895 [Selenomonadaceae bacterium]|nr:hypothetical protein [Selenomonadaceae bacterium]